VAQQLALAADLAISDDAAMRLAKLDRLLKQAVDLDDATVSLIAAATGLIEADPVAIEADPRRRRERTLEGLLAQILGLASQRPLLLVVEDAHWLDPTTLELFDQVLGRTARVPVLALFTSRPENAPQFGAHPQLTRLSLNRLSREATARIAADIMGAPLPEDIISAILDRADGVPLFAEELAQAVLDARKTDGQGAPWQRSNGVPPRYRALSLRGSTGWEPQRRSRRSPPALVASSTTRFWPPSPRNPNSTCVAHWIGSLPQSSSSSAASLRRPATHSNTRSSAMPPTTACSG
jgi:predicted ATPase